MYESDIFRHTVAEEFHKITSHIPKIAELLSAYRIEELKNFYHSFGVFVIKFKNPESLIMYGSFSLEQ